MSLDLRIGPATSGKEATAAKVKSVTMLPNKSTLFTFRANGLMFCPTFPNCASTAFLAPRRSDSLGILAINTSIACHPFKTGWRGF